MEILQTLKNIDTVVSIAKPIIETVAPRLCNLRRPPVGDALTSGRSAL